MQGTTDEIITLLGFFYAKEKTVRNLPEGQWNLSLCHLVEEDDCLTRRN
jgi:hypothetical protein